MPNFMLSHEKGFLNLGEETSKWQGWFVYEEDVYKILEALHIEEPYGEATNEYSLGKRKRGKTEETYYLPKGLQTLVYKLKSPRFVTLTFDIRKANDYSTEELHYHVEKTSQGILITYRKGKKGKKFIRYVVISGDIHEFANVGKWKEQNYADDKERNSLSSRWTYQACICKTKQLIITTASTSKRAWEENHLVVEGLQKMQKADKIKVTNKAAHALSSLLTPQGLFAGLPWFTQIWTRDESISLEGLRLAGKDEKKIILERIHQLREDGRLPNRVPHSDLGSADSVGWLFFRASQLKWDKQEKEVLTIALKKSIEKLIQRYHKNGFFENEGLETWMDTGKGYDERGGVRIEIQALMLVMFSFAYKLTKEEMYKKLEESLAKNVKKHLFRNNYLWDGKEDPTIRPNIFLASYVYPELLVKREWTVCFEIVLDVLWLEWGGLTTIDKKNKLFTPQYTGENNKSYHRGDSWYWVNNLAAICLLRVNKRKFKSYADKIYEASVFDLEHLGAIGCCSEVSSASHQTASGCLNQAWSNATLLELEKELKH